MDRDNQLPLPGISYWIVWADSTTVLDGVDRHKLRMGWTRYDELAGACDAARAANALYGPTVAILNAGAYETLGRVVGIVRGPAIADTEWLQADYSVPLRPRRGLRRMVK